MACGLAAAMTSQRASGTTRSAAIGDLSCCVLLRRCGLDLAGLGGGSVVRVTRPIQSAVVEHNTAPLPREGEYLCSAQACGGC